MNLSNSVVSILAVTGTALSGICLLLLLGRAVRDRAERGGSPVPANERV